MIRKSLLILFLTSIISNSSSASEENTDDKLQSLSGKKKLEYLIQLSQNDLKYNFDNSLRYARMALVLATELQDDEGKTESYFLISDGYRQLKKLDSAWYYSRLALSGFNRTGNKTGILRSENQQGMLLFSEGKFQEAEEMLLKTFELSQSQLARQPDDKNLKTISAEVFNNLMIIYIGMGSYQQARDKLLEFSRKNHYGDSFTGMLIQGNLSTAYYMMGQYDSALIRARESLRIAITLGEQTNKVKIMMDIGNIQHAMGRNLEALDIYQNALNDLQGMQDPVKQASLYNNMASIYRSLSWYEKATAFFIEAIRIKEELQDSTGLALNFNNLALTYMDMGNFIVAGKYYRKAVVINFKKGNRKSLSANYNGLGDLFYNLKKPDSSLFFYRKSLEIKRQIGFKKGMAASLKGIGSVYSQLLNNNEQAFIYFTEALGLAKEIGAAYDIAELNACLGELFYNKNDLKTALPYLKDGLDYAQKENAYDIVLTCSRLLTEISVKNGEPVKSVEYFKRFREAQDTIFNQSKTRAILEMQTKYETEKKEKENQVLMENAQQQRTKISFLIVFAVIVTLLGLVISLLYRQKSKALQQIVLKNLEIVKTENHLEAHKQFHQSHEENSLTDVPLEIIENTRLGLLIKFQKHVEEDKPYLKAGLSLDDVCRRIGTNRTYLSQMINENYNQNFNGYVNDLRIKEARRLLSLPEFNHISVEGIGSMAGFSSKVTFHTNFKSLIGVTPSYYRNTAAKHQDAQSTVNAGMAVSGTNSI